MLWSKDVFFFDMGNTVLDLHKGPSDAEKDQMGLAHLGRFLKYYKKRTIPISHLHYQFLIPWNMALDKRTASGGEPDVLGLLNNALGHFNVTLSEAECKIAMQEFFQEYKKHLVVTPGVTQLLATLKKNGRRVGIISNCTMYQEIFEDLFSYAGLAKFIDTYIFSYTQGIRKPNPQLFNKALADFPVSSEKAVMIGDRLDADIAGAKELEITTVWYNPGKKPRNSSIVPDIEINSWDQLFSYLRDGGTVPVSR